MHESDMHKRNFTDTEPPPPTLPALSDLLAAAGLRLARLALHPLPRLVDLYSRTCAWLEGRARGARRRAACHERTVTVGPVCLAMDADGRAVEATRGGCRHAPTQRLLAAFLVAHLRDLPVACSDCTDEVQDLFPLLGDVEKAVSAARGLGRIKAQLGVTAVVWVPNKGIRNVVVDAEAPEPQAAQASPSSSIRGANIIRTVRAPPAANVTVIG